MMKQIRTIAVLLVVAGSESAVLAQTMRCEDRRESECTGGTVTPEGTFNCSWENNKCIGTRSYATDRVVTMRDAKAVQEILNSKGAKVKVDGKLGKETAAAVMEYQKREGLAKVDGKLGPETLGRLYDRPKQ